MLGDVRLGVRIALRNPLWAAGIVVSLALGIGATVTVFSAVNALMLYRIPAPHREELVEMENSIGGRGVEQNLTDYRRVREAAAPFAQVAAYHPAQAFQFGQERVWGQLVTENYFPVLGIQPVAGRFFADGEPAVVLSEAFWRRRFNGNLRVIGEAISLNGRPVTIVGIAPEGFRGVRTGFLPALWVPLAAARVLLPNSFPRDAAVTGVRVFARLRPGLALAQAQAGMDAATANIDSQFPIAEYWPMKGQRRLRLEPAGQFLSNFRELAETLLQLLSALAGFVLLIGCANAANLQLARATAREGEFATRRALGATRARLIGQLTFESLTLGLAGGAAGLGLAYLSLRALAAIRLPDLPVVLDLTMPIDARVAAFVAGLTLTVTLVSGLAAAWRGTSEAAGRHWLRDLLVVTQVGLAVVLTIATGLLIRSLRNAQRIDVGFHAEQTVLAQFDPLLQGFEPNRIEPLVRELTQNGGAVTDSVPLTLGGSLADLGPEDKLSFVNQYSVTRGFFEALGIPILAGRDFATEGDKGRVLINQALARLLFGNASPIGRRIGEKGQYEVIGLVRDHANFFLEERDAPILYRTLFQEPVSGPLTLAIRGGNLPLAPVDFYNVRTGGQQLESAMFVPRATAALTTAFGVLGLVLTAIGLYALMAYSVSRRMRELGIRIALGARPLDLLKTVFHRTAVLVAIGTALGLVAAFNIAKVMDGVFYNLPAADPVTFAGGTTLLVAIAGLASWLPARRASTSQPIDALRQE